MPKAKYPVRAINETGDTTIDVQLFQVPDSAITAGSGTVSIASSTGDVTGPSSSTDNAIARFDGTTGKTIQNSAVTIADTTGAIAGARSIALSGSTSGSVTVAVPAIAGSNTVTLPAGTTDFSATGGTNQVLKQASAGAALTVGTLASTNLSDT